MSKNGTKQYHRTTAELRGGVASDSITSLWQRPVIANYGDGSRTPDDRPLLAKMLIRPKKISVIASVEVAGPRLAKVGLKRRLEVAARMPNHR